MSSKDEMRERAASAKKAAESAQKKRDRLISLIGAAVIAAVVATIGVYYVTRPSKPACIPGTDICEDRNAALPAGVSNDSYSVGAFPAKSGVPQVEIYEDFQCPVCAAFEAAYGKLVLSWAKAGKINVVWRPATFLDTNLASENAKNGNPDSSVRATAAFGCAVDAGKGLEYHSALFAAQPATEGVGYSDMTLAKLGAQVGIKGAAKDTFDACVASGKFRPWALSSYTQFIKNGMKGTPSVVVNGTLLDSTTYPLTAQGTAADPKGAKLWKAITDAAK